MGWLVRSQCPSGVRQKHELALTSPQAPVSWASWLELEVHLQRKLNDSRAFLCTGGVPEGRVVRLATGAIGTTEVVNIQAVKELGAELHRVLAFPEGEVLIQPEVEVREVRSDGAVTS